MSDAVSIVKCSNYAYERVRGAVKESIDLLGGMEQFVKPGQRVLLKINLLTAAPPEKAVTTHPAVVSALAELVRNAGGRPLVADSPGPIPYTSAGLKRAYKAAGLLDMAEAGVFDLNWDTSVQWLSFAGGQTIKRIEVISPVIKCDVIIAVPKLKTHMFTTFTGAAKILFGVIPGLTKAGYHAKLQTSEQFAGMLLDIVNAVKPALFVMDGVLALEGDGPGLHGIPRSLGIVMASRNPIAMDAVACDIIDINPLDVPMLSVAVDRGMWDGNLDNLPVVGAPTGEVAVKDFKKPSRVARDARGLDRLAGYQRIWAPVVKQALTPRPVPGKEKCSGCATCYTACPQGAVTISKGRAFINDSACIRCYCCHEMCPEAAIELKFGLLGRIIRRFGLLGKL
ncbi:DUF362 domain-containing protein [Desulfoscipio sp. XC116]|uniref:DUF362 domain-containing protein n=1 Tax=Desulfoscipio sp. XC116 TaxID=3144975 RepID=UPI00325ABED6